MCNQVRPVREELLTDELIGEETDLKGLELARQFYETVGEPMLKRTFPNYTDRIAAGLVGEGSECFGFDDEISRDHDFGARFCIWLPADIYHMVGNRMRQAYEELPNTFRGFPVLKEAAAGGARRSGVFSIESFYRQILGGSLLLEKETDWFHLKESTLAAATNGMVFTDPAGLFSTFRNKLLGYYPENVRLKKMSVCLAYMAQTGQVNYARSMRRKDLFTAEICVSEFVRAALSVLYLLNRRYMPYYKWALTGLRNAHVLSQTVLLLEELRQTRPQSAAWESRDLMDTSLNFHDRNVELIEEICGQIAQELIRQKISDSPEKFLNVQFLQVHSRITSEEIREIPVRMPEYMI